MEINPPRPLEAVPLPMYNEPELPRELVPVLMMIMPLTPDTPASAVVISKIPLEVDVPAPVVIYIAPPVAADDDPADNNNWPPLPLFPEPTVIEINPPRPLDAAPLPI